MSLHPHRSSPLPAPVTSQSLLHPAPLDWLLCSMWTIFVGTVSASSLHPALSRDENQVCPEEALQRVFLCSTEGTFVCVLQDKSETQAEAGLNCWWRCEKLLWDCEHSQQLCCNNKLFGWRTFIIFSLLFCFPLMVKNTYFITEKKLNSDILWTMISFYPLHINHSCRSDFYKQLVDLIIIFFWFEKFCCISWNTTCWVVAYLNIVKGSASYDLSYWALVVYQSSTWGSQSLCYIHTGSRLLLKHKCLFDALFLTSVTLRKLFLSSSGLHKSVFILTKKNTRESSVEGFLFWESNCCSIAGTCIIVLPLKARESTMHTATLTDCDMQTKQPQKPVWFEMCLATNTEWDWHPAWIVLVNICWRSIK